MTSRDRLTALLDSRIGVLDGSWGVLIHRRGLTEEEYRGERFADHPRDLRGDPDLLNLTRPDIVLDIHRAYLDAGADITTTNTFTATSIGQADYGLEASAAEMAYEGARSSTSAIIVDDAGERLIVGQRDAGMPSGTSWLPLERVAGADAVLGDVRWLEGLRSTFQRAREANVITLLDAELGAREALPGILKLTDYAIFSRPSLREFAPGDTDEDRLKAVLALGPRHVGVTRGAEGYAWREHDGSHGVQAAFPVTVTDTTGAGDAFHGAFALMIAEGRTTADAVRMACAVAALKCTRLGSRAGLPTRAEAEALLGS